MHSAAWWEQDAATPGLRKIHGVQTRPTLLADIEGRISVLMHGPGMKRCRAEGAERFALFVAAAVLANNLMIIGAA